MVFFSDVKTVLHFRQNSSYSARRDSAYFYTFFRSVVSLSSFVCMSVTFVPFA